MNANKSNGQYEVLSPWAEVEPVPLRGIAPRATDLAGNKIGLFCNVKRSARAMMTVVEEKLKERFPSSEIGWYLAHKPNIAEIETEGKAAFEEWVKGIDTVITAVGD